MSTLQPLSPAPKTTRAHAPCLYYYSQMEQKEYIILTPHCEDTNKCYKYDIEQNEWIHFTTYPQNIRASCHSFIIDQKNDLLYICCGHDTIFATYNFNNNQWITQSISKIEGNYVANAPVVLLPHSQLHLLGKPSANTYHLCFNKTKRKFVKVSENGIENNNYLSASTFVYVKNKSMLLVLGGYCNGPTDKIWFSEYTGLKQINFVWKTFPIKLPHAGYPKATLIFGALVIIWYKYGNNVGMDILDCGTDKYEWIKPILPENEYPKGINSLICTNSNYLHFVHPYDEMHCKIHLSKVLPNALIDKYRKYYFTLLYGYMKQNVLCNESIIFPNDLCCLIIRFYCNFSMFSSLKS
eukprot:186567_1